MNAYPQQYSYTYTPAQYQAMQLQSIMTVLTGVVMLVALGAWAFSLVRKASRGEEVKFPL